MAVTTPIMYKGMYCGSMNEETIQSILATRECKIIPNLKNFLYKFPESLIERSILEEKSILNILEEEGKNANEYIHELKDYQTVGTAFLILSKRSILGDGVGLGKTAEISALINFLRVRKLFKKALVAVETTAFYQTLAELIKFTGLYVVVLPSESKDMKKVIKNTDWSKVDVIVIKHSSLRSDTLSTWISLNIDKDGKCSLYDTFILDESSVIKKVTTKTYRYTENICNLADRVHFLNATTFETHIMDIYNQVDMMIPNLLPKRWRIDKEFCKFGWNTYFITENGKPVEKFSRKLVGYKNQEKFKEALKLVYFGRCKNDIGMELNHEHYVFEIEPSIDQLLAIEKGYRYMEVLNCPSLVKDIHLKTDRKNVPKLDRLIELIENEFDKDRIMVYCFHTEAQLAIKKELESIGKKAAILNGSITGEERWEIQKDFNDGKYDVIITNIKKSLNLYGGDVCIYYSMETVPSAMQQISGRIDRNVDDKTKTFVLLVYKHTDEYRFLLDVLRQRSKDSRDLTINSKTIVDYFIESMGDMK